MKTYWISFVDETNLGCCIVDAENEKEAIEKTLELKINPGGEAMLCELPANGDADDEIKKWGKNRLISQEDLMNDGYKKLKDFDDETRHIIEGYEGLSIVCEKHNSQY